jgi:hypothetical protein
MQTQARRLKGIQQTHAASSHSTKQALQHGGLGGQGRVGLNHQPHLALPSPHPMLPYLYVKEEGVGNQVVHLYVCFG